uniref:Uncharacterized protein n=1 Tax=Utricularia reniformis TaxID=192314 RepID=A0A1Y0B0J2_9LAMI|nr:hypothetical protein AEK19_MT0732 [Utricularia reniformis]ART30976.1 hypothetical protein AEK19_MT0732 [Utricularia reniformis]
MWLLDPYSFLYSYKSWLCLQALASGNERISRSRYLAILWLSIC